MITMLRLQIFLIDAVGLMVHRLPSLVIQMPAELIDSDSRHVARVLVVFFFQAEDGIRDLTVTGVQTCALPIYLRAGASIMLSDRSPLSLAMWDQLTRAGATSLAAVPTTYAAFGPAHVNLLNRTKIRTMTQSGARLGDELTMRLVRLMEQRQGRLLVK